MPWGSRSSTPWIVLGWREIGKMRQKERTMEEIVLAKWNAQQRLERIEERLSRLRAEKRKWVKKLEIALKEMTNLAIATSKAADEESVKST